MGFTVAGLKRAHVVRQWRNILSGNSYVAVVQLTGGRSWGRINMKARVLGDYANSGGVDAKYAVPWAARSAAEDTAFAGLANLFRSSPCAVIYGNDIGSVLAVLARARQQLDGGIVIGGRFGEDVITSRMWDTASDLRSEQAVREDLVRVLGTPPQLVNHLRGSSHGLVKSLQDAAGSTKLVRVLDRQLANLKHEPTG